MPLVERVLDRVPCRSLEDYRARGGGRGLDAAQRLGAAATIDEIEAAGLRGRGGGGFPTGVKWRTVSAARSPVRSTTVVVNGAEGEPGTFKDRAIIRANPYKVLEGALIAALAVEASEVVVALKRTFEIELARIRGAVDEMRTAGWSPGVDVRVVAGPDEYLFGEETALLEVIDGRAPFPRVTPPYRRGVDPVDGGNPASGVDLAAPGGTDEPPALVDNVETMANVPGILAEGADWFRSVGTVASPGTIVCTMSGRCRVHGVGEVAMGTPLREAIDLIGGGAIAGRVVAAMSGVANPIVPEQLLDTALAYEAMAEIGSGLGTGGYFVFDEQTDLVAVAHAAARFLAVESCGLCEPCKRDGLTIATKLEAIKNGTGTARDFDSLPRLLDTVTTGARCFLATQQDRVVRSALRLFPDAFAAHLSGATGPTPREWIVPIVDIEGTQAVLDEAHDKKQPDWSYDEFGSGASPASLYGSGPVDIVEPGGAREDVSWSPTTVRSAGPSPDPLQPLLDMHRDIRRALDRLSATDEGTRSGAIDELRWRLQLHDDVTRRVVHPIAQRHAGTDADDPIWLAEDEESDAEARLRRIGRLDDLARDPASLVAPLVDEVHHALDRDEATIVRLLRERLDPDDLVDLGDAIQEACATSRVNIS